LHVGCNASGKYNGLAALGKVIGSIRNPQFDLY
jgi:hypothetical protein